MHDEPENEEQPSGITSEFPVGEDPREEKLGKARHAARHSVLSDLADDVHTMTGLVSDLHVELEELTEQNARRWNNGKWALFFVVLLLAVNIFGMLYVRGLQAQLENEVQRRVSSTCEAIEVSRQAFNSLVDVIKQRSDRPLPEVDDPELQEILEEGRERNKQLVGQLEDITRNVSCERL